MRTPVHCAVACRCPPDFPATANGFLATFPHLFNVIPKDLQTLCRSQEDLVLLRSGRLEKASNIPVNVIVMHYIRPHSGPEAEAMQSTLYTTISLSQAHGPHAWKFHRPSTSRCSRSQDASRASPCWRRMFWRT
jgi:hypothetical protein